MPNKVSEDDHETYDDVLDTPADDNLQQNCTIEMDIYKPTWSGVDYSKQSSNHSPQNDIARVHCFSLFKPEFWMLVWNQLCSFQSKSN